MRRKPYKPFVKKEFVQQEPYNPNAGIKPNENFLNEEKHIFGGTVEDIKKKEDI